MALDIEKMQKNPNAKVTVVGSGIRFNGFITEDFTFDSAASFNPMFDDSKSNVASEFLNKASHGISNIAALMGQNLEVPNFKLQSIASTVETWSTTDKPNFAIPMVVIATRPEHDVIALTKPLISSQYPSESSSLTLRPPLGYDSSTKEGTVTIKIGRWFRALNHILTSSGVTFSKETITSGKPLYAMVSIGFRPQKLPTARDIEAYFPL